jgi:hypothetical protein
MTQGLLAGKRFLLQALQVNYQLLMVLHKHYTVKVLSLHLLIQMKN